MALTMSRTGVLNLSGSNAYSGGTTVSSGTLQLGMANALGSGGLTANGGRPDPQRLQSYPPCPEQRLDRTLRSRRARSPNSNSSSINLDREPSLHDGLQRYAAGRGKPRRAGPGARWARQPGPFRHEHLHGWTTVLEGRLTLTNIQALADASSLTVGSDAAAFAAALPAAEASGTIAAVPEPGTLALLAVALGSAAVYGRLGEAMRLEI